MTCQDFGTVEFNNASWACQIAAAGGNTPAPGAFLAGTPARIASGYNIDRVEIRVPALNQHDQSRLHDNAGDQRTLKS